MDTTQTGAVVSLGIENENRSSIELSRGTKGAYSWKVKLYFDSSKQTMKEILNDLDIANCDLLSRYGTDSMPHSKQSGHSVKDMDFEGDDV